MNRLDEAISKVLATAPARPELHELRRRTRRRRSIRAAAVFVVVGIVSGAALAVVRSTGSTATPPRIAVSPSSTKTTPKTTPKPNPRGAAGNVGYVEQLVAEQLLPHFEAVTGVTAQADEIVVSTSVRDTQSAEELWEGLSGYVDCDDSFLFVKGLRVLLEDGTAITKGRPGFKACGAGGAYPAPSTGLQSCGRTYSEVRASFGFLESADSAVGGIVLTNTGSTPCTLSGRAIVTLVGSDGTPLAVERTVGAGNTPPPASTAPIALSARSAQPQAGVRVDWRNWCRGASGALTVDIRFPDWGNFVVGAPDSHADPTTTPPCLDPTKPSPLGVSAVLAHDASGYHSPSGAKTGP